MASLTNANRLDGVSNLQLARTEIPVKGFDTVPSQNCSKDPSGNSRIRLDSNYRLIYGAIIVGMRFFTFWTTPPETFRNRYLRSIESVLFHHPCSHVTVYSNSLPEDFLSELSSHGYDVQIQPIRLKEVTTNFSRKFPTE